MTQESMQAQLDALLAEVEALREERATRSNDDGDGDGEEGAADAPHKLKELLSRLEEELDELPTVASLGVFALGVLLGRFLR